MDEHVPHGITVQLRLRAVDVLTAQEDGRKGAPDEAVLARATLLERVLFTQDDDFLGHTRKQQAAGGHFTGLIYTHQMRANIGMLVRDLEMVAKVMEPEDMADTVVYLPL